MSYHTPIIIEMGDFTPFSEPSASRFGARGFNERIMGTNHYKQAFDNEFTTLKFDMTPLVFY